jgi:hypothetical protein
VGALGMYNKILSFYYTNPERTRGFDALIHQFVVNNLPDDTSGSQTKFHDPNKYYSNSTSSPTISSNFAVAESSNLTISSTLSSVGSFTSSTIRVSDSSSFA